MGKHLPVPYCIAKSAAHPVAPKGLKADCVPADQMDVPVVWAPTSVAGKLAVLLREFDRDPQGIGHRIRQLLDAGAEDFRSAAVEFLKSAGESGAFYYLVSLLAAEGMLIAVLCESALSVSQMAATVRAAHRFDALADLKIARSLTESVIANDRAIPVKGAVRLLDVLDQVSDSRRIVAPLMRLLRHPNPELRSKVIKIIGRGSRSARWVQGRLAETDPRVRANAIESLNGVDTAEARGLLLASVHDPDNRVVGNALVALYHLGETEIIGDFFRIAAEKSARFRATAAWAIGQTGDPRFSEALVRLMQDGEASVRSRAFRSLTRIKAAAAKARMARPWHIAGSVRQGPPGGQRVLRFAVASEDGAPEPSLLGTHVILSEGSKRIVSYRFMARAPADRMSLSFVFPCVKQSAAPWVRGALNCAPWKRPGDLWRLIPYAVPEAVEQYRAAKHAALLTADLEALQMALLSPPDAAESSDLWTALRQARHSEEAGNPGKCHVIIFNCSDRIAPPPDDLVASPTAAGLVQAVSTVDCPALEDFCRRKGGAFYLAASSEEAASLIQSCYLTLLANYEVVYTPAISECRQVKLQVQTSSGWGEAEIPVLP